MDEEMQRNFHTPALVSLPFDTLNLLVICMAAVDNNI